MTDGNLMELACKHCAQQMRRHGRQVALVLHRFNMVGQLIETHVVDKRKEGETDGEHNC